MDRAVYGMSGDNEWIGESINTGRGADRSSCELPGVLPREHEHLKTPDPGRSKNERFVQVPKAPFWDLFICPAYKGIKQQVLAWVVDQTWGQHDWVKGGNRQFTKEPISPTLVARDIDCPRESVSRALADLRADGVLIKGESGGEGIDKDRLHELAERDASVTPRTVMPTSHRDAHVTPSVMPTSHHRDAHVTVNPHNTQPDRQLPTLHTIHTIQTKRERGAAPARASAHPDFQDFVDWWRSTWSEYNGGNQYPWSPTDGSHLKRLLRTLGFGDLQARAAYAFAHAGKPGHLEWFKPPFTFKQFAHGEVINCCIQSSSPEGYLTADQLCAQEENHAHPASSP